jgi:hypothetical protein
LPVYLEPEIEEFIGKLAKEKVVGKSQTVNMILKKG